MNTDLWALARRARAGQNNTTVRYREDGALLMVRGAEEPLCPVDLDGLPLEPRTLHYHPARGATAEQARAELKKLRETHPDLRIHGLSPGWVALHGLDPQVDSLCLFTGPLNATANGVCQSWESALQLPVPKVASFVYGPTSTLAQVRERCAQLREARELVAVLPLPAAVGDRVVVPGATTAGVLDVEVLATCGAELPGIPVRASWAALGWKISQCTLPFGVSELSGWGLEELLAYSSRSRPASVVGAAEVLAGIAEARREAESGC